MQLIEVYLANEGSFSDNVAKPSKQDKMKIPLSDWAKDIARLEHKNSEILLQRVSPSETNTDQQIKHNQRKILQALTKKQHLGHFRVVDLSSGRSSQVF